MNPNHCVSLGIKNEDKIILDLCGGTGAWSKPYKEAGAAWAAAMAKEAAGAAMLLKILEYGMKLLEAEEGRRKC